jgi:hypothetical protein
MNMRALIAALLAGLLGLTVSGIWLFMLNLLLQVEPPRNIGIILLFGLPSGFITSFLAFELYAKSDFHFGSLFGALSGAISGAISGIGFIIGSYYDYNNTPVVLELIGNGLAGALIGTLTGLVLGKFLGPFLAKVNRISY